MKPILSVEHIEKIYRIGSLHSYKTLRDGLFKFKREKKEYIKALDDVSFDVYPGDKIGVIGRNGAGKSTLLKILSRITPPSGGRAIIRGKVASLLEVGTGFHGELTGRENIFFNGAILGMKRNEIKRKLDEIVAFAGVEKFLDTPVKHYSSGMQLRLAFAVAAFLDADILLVDEVLAVGDAEFQKKSLGKMDEVSKSGRTVLFVSHNMGAIEQLCSRAILLHNGNIINDGLKQGVINNYFSLLNTKTPFLNRNIEHKQAFFSSVYLSNIKNEPKENFFFNEKIVVNLSFHLFKKLDNTILAVVLANNYYPRITVFFKNISEFRIGVTNIKLIIPSHIISPGNYYFNLFIYRPNDTIFDKVENACPFQIYDSDIVDSHLFNGNYGFFIINNVKWEVD